MEITHAWKIKLLQRLNDGTGTVCHIKFNIESTHEGTTFKGPPHSIDLETEGISDFIPYDELNEEIVVSWIKAKIGQYCEKLESENEKMIESRINPVPPSKISESPNW